MSKRYSVPSNVSPETAAQLSKLYSLLARTPKRTRPQTLEDWDRANAQLDKIARPTSTATADALHVTRTEDRLAGVSVLRVRPADYEPGGATILYLHGGAFTSFSAGNSLALPALMSTATGHEVISIDYTLAPRADWHVITDQVLAAYKAVLASGVKPESIGMMGDSAGGNLVAGSVLKMRDQHVPLPVAFDLISPGVDVTGAGDTNDTLAAADPVLSIETSVEQRKLCTGCRRPDESDRVPCVRGLYEALSPYDHSGKHPRDYPEQCGARVPGNQGRAVLDIYEGMPHVFMSFMPQAPETKTAIKRAANFFASRLRSGTK